MGKKGKTILAGQTKQQRIEQRKQLGSLKSLTVQPGTKKRYDLALRQFFDFLRFEGISIPKQRHKMDDLVSDYLEHLWANGEGRALASDSVAALQDADPHLKGALPGSWRLLKVWGQNELPNRAPPLPESILQALVGRAILNKDEDFALSLLVGFYGMLRTGEILSLQPRQVDVSSSGFAVVSLGMTKGGRRQGAAESVTISVFDVVRRLRAWKAKSRTPFAANGSAWRGKFHEYLQALGLESFAFRPYSLRRGGATFWFSKHGSLDRLLIAGRWQAPKTARIYLNEGLARLAEMQVPLLKLRGFLQIYQTALDKALPSLERTCKAGSSGGRGRSRVKVCCFLFFWEMGRSQICLKVLVAWSSSGLAVDTKGHLYF